MEFPVGTDGSCNLVPRCVSVNSSGVNVLIIGLGVLRVIVGPPVNVNVRRVLTKRNTSGIIGGGYPVQDEENM